jgi:hypothetical protein
MESAGRAAMDWLTIFDDPKRAGLTVLIALGAVIAGKMVYNVWPKHRNPAFWGTATAMLIVGALAFLGISEAAIVVWVFIALALIYGAAALVL